MVHVEDLMETFKVNVNGVVTEREKETTFIVTEQKIVLK